MSRLFGFSNQKPIVPESHPISNHHPPGTLLEAALQLLLATCYFGGRDAARQLYVNDVSGTLKQLSQFCSVEVVEATRQLYGWLCLYSYQLRDEVMQDNHMMALSGVLELPTVTAAAAAPTACTGTAAAAAAAAVPLKMVWRLQAAALNKLLSVIDTAGGREFAGFIGAELKHGSSRPYTGSSSSSTQTHSGPGVAAAAAGGPARGHLVTARRLGGCGLTAVTARRLGGCGLTAVIGLLHQHCEQQQQQQQQVFRLACQVRSFSSGVFIVTILTSRVLAGISCWVGAVAVLAVMAVQHG